MATTIQPVKTVMTRADAAEYLGVCKATLDLMPIPKTQIRRKVFYQKEAIDKWLLQNAKVKSPA